MLSLVQLESKRKKLNNFQVLRLVKEKTQSNKNF